MKRSFNHRIVALLLIAPVTSSAATGISPWLPVIGSSIPAMTGLSNASIASGTANQQQGESTQNMAQMAMGAMQIAQGLMGLMAAANAAQQQGTGSQRETNLGSSWNPEAYQSTIGQGTSPTPGSSNTGGTTGSSATNGATVKLSPEALRNGTLGAALSGIEKNFGIPRDDFVKALQNGVDPKDLLANAPKNKPSMDTLKQIEAGLASNGGASAELAKMAAGLNGSGSSQNLASVGGAGTGSAPTGAAAEESGKPRMPASTAPPEESLEDMNAATHATLSPEIKAALAAKAAQIKAEKERGDSLNWSIFQLVHDRYKKLEPMLYGRVERTNVKPAPQEL